MLGVKDSFPRLEKLIEQNTNEIGIPLTWSGVVFFIIDSIHSALVVYRMNERQSGNAETNRFWNFFDRHYPDAKGRKIYPNMKFIHRSTEVDHNEIKLC
ncbi:MAG: hypothetical protein IJ325_06450 [Clostridia bacterium]|nr:hypothetical protein [Clostridia bacterium]